MLVVVCNRIKRSHISSEIHLMIGHKLCSMSPMQILGDFLASFHRPTSAHALQMGCTRTFRKSNSVTPTLCSFRFCHFPTPCPSSTSVRHKAWLQVSCHLRTHSRRQSRVLCNQGRLLRRRMQSGFHRMRSVHRTRSCRLRSSCLGSGRRVGQARRAATGRSRLQALG